jgi:hypothetical protein
MAAVANLPRESQNQLQRHVDEAPRAQTNAFAMQLLKRFRFDAR